MLEKLTLGDFARFKKAALFTTLYEIYGFCSILIVAFFMLELLKREPNVAYLWGLCALALVYMIGFYYAQRPAYRACFNASYENSAKGRLALARHICNLSLGALLGKNKEVLSNSLLRDFTNLEQANSHMLPNLAASVILSVLVFMLLCFFNLPLAFAYFSFVPLGLIVLFFAQKVTKYLGVRHMDALLDARAHISEYTAGIATFKAYNMQGGKFERLQKSFDELRKRSIAIEVGVMPFALMALTCMGAGIGIMVFVSRSQLESGAISPAMYLVIILIASRAFVPLLNFSINFIELNYYAKSGENILKIMRQKINQGNENAPVNNDIVINNLSFAYKDEVALKNINLSLKQGSFTAIVGPSGSGKSTLLKLIAGFYEPSSGSISLGGVDISKIKQDELMKKFSMVFQQSTLFSGSIASNVALGKKDASKDEILMAIKLANAGDFVTKLGGVDANIAENAKSLSGGQKQRLAIARCILKDAPIVLLDEMSSSLDVYNEYALQRAFSELSRGKSLILIAHRLKSVINADNIVVLDKGEIVQSGTHEELLKQGGLYAKMWDESA